MKTKLLIVTLVIISFFSVFVSCARRNSLFEEQDINSVEPIVEITGAQLSKTNSIASGDGSRTNDIEIAQNMYKEFLSGKRSSVEGLDINSITISTGEPDKHYATKYTYFDSTWDEIPELHIKSARSYDILTISDNKLIVWKSLIPNPQYYLINNGAFMTYHPGGAPKHDEYSYFILDSNGNEWWSIGFGKYDSNQNGEYDSDDEYYFDNVKVTKDMWEALTERYLFVDTDGIERIRDEVEWVVIYEETN